MFPFVVLTVAVIAAPILQFKELAVEIVPFGNRYPKVLGLQIFPPPSTIELIGVMMGPRIVVPKLLLVNMLLDATNALVGIALSRV